MTRKPTPVDPLKPFMPRKSRHDPFIGRCQAYATTGYRRKKQCARKAHDNELCYCGFHWRRAKAHRLYQKA